MTALILRHGAFGILGVVFSLIGTISALVAAGLAWDLHQDRVNYVQVEGKVVGQRRWNRGYRPVVEFDAGGQPATVTGVVGNSSPVFEVGESVTVLYPAGDPGKARIDHWTESGFGILFGGFFCLVFGVSGYILLYLTVRKARGASWARAHGMTVQADFSGVDRDGRIRVNGRSPYVIAAQWRNPRDQRVYRFTSAPTWVDPTPYVRGRQHITVRLDPDRPSRYWMDTAFLPEAG